MGTAGLALLVTVFAGTAGFWREGGASAAGTAESGTVMAAVGGGAAAASGSAGQRSTQSRAMNQAEMRNCVCVRAPSSSRARFIPFGGTQEGHAVPMESLPPLLRPPDVDPASLIALQAQGGTLLCLGLPKASQFGLDYAEWSVGPRFLGISVVPPGPHFLWYRYDVVMGEGRVREGG